MLRILYAADNRSASFCSLKRFLDSYAKFYEIKVAAYTKSINNLNCNWNLDALLDFRGKSKGVTFQNSNYALYVREIKRFSPDLVISDLELYTSYAALELGIPVWQVSPLLLYYGLSDKSLIYKYYSGLFSKDVDRNKYISYILSNADKKLILSHIADLNNKPTVVEGYDWARPNYNILETNNHCLHVSSNGITLADHYFSGNLTTLQVDYSDPESIVAAHYNCKYGLSFANEKDAKSFDITIDSNVKFLSQHLKDLDI